MFMTRTPVKRLIGVLALAAAACALTAGPAAAQLDSGIKWIMQLEDDRWVKRGEIFVPDKTDPDHYVEHWVLHPEYRYPSQTVDVTMRFQTPKHAVASEREFFAQRFPAGSRYVHVIADESDVIPLASALQIPTGLR